MSDPTTADAATPPPATPKSRRLRKWAIGFAIVFGLLLTVAVFGRNALLRAGLQRTVSRVTGFPLSIGTFDLGLTTTRLEAHDMVLTNPDGFEDRRCISIPELVLDPEVASLFSTTVHIEELTLAIDEVVVVKNASGETNLDRLKALGGDGDDPGTGGGGTKPDGTEKEGGMRKVRIDFLHLKIGTVRFLDFSRMKDGKPRQEEWKLNLDEEFRDLDSPEKVVRLVVLRVLQRTNLKLVRSSVDDLIGGLGGVGTGAGGAIGTVVDGLGKGVNDALGGLLGK
jgi:hypothetical protein